MGPRPVNKKVGEVPTEYPSLKHRSDEGSDCLQKDTEKCRSQRST